MNMEYLSNLLVSSSLILSSQFCNFPHIDLIHILLLKYFFSFLVVLQKVMCFITFCLCFMSNSTCPLLVYRDTNDYILTFYPTICLLVPGGLVFFLFFFFFFFFGNSLESSIWTIMCSMNKDFYFFLLICISFISFSVLIALVSNSSTILKRSGERRHSCFVAYLSRKVTKKYNVSCRFL